MRGLTNIIIPAIELNDELLKCLTEINKINFSNFFVSILLDRNSKRKIPKFRYKLNKLVVGKINISCAVGSILTFLGLKKILANKVYTYSRQRKNQ